MTFADKFVDSCRNRGLMHSLGLVIKTLVHEFRWYLDRSFDRRFGTDTSGRIELDKLTIDSDHRRHGVYYEPTSTHLLLHMLMSLPIRMEDFTFVDFGSGKGRVLLVASGLPFRRIVGIEFSRDLHQIAERNILRYRNPRQRCRLVESICIDAAIWPLPDEPSVYYFYNPFDQVLTETVLANMRRAADQHGKPSYLLYFNCLHDELVRRVLLPLDCIPIRLPYDYTRKVQRRATLYVIHK